MYAQYKINTPNRTPSKRSNLINYKTNDHNESNADEIITCSELRCMVKELLQGRSKNLSKPAASIYHQTDNHAIENRANESRGTPTSKQMKKNSDFWRVYQCLEPLKAKKTGDEYNPMWDDLISQLKEERKSIINKYKAAKKEKELDKKRAGNVITYSKNDHINMDRYHPNAWDIDEQRRRDLMRLKYQGARLMKKTF